MNLKIDISSAISGSSGRRLFFLALAVLLSIGASFADICDNAQCENTINVSAGNNFTIELESNSGSTGFEWWSSFDGGYISLEGVHEIEDNASIEGPAMSGAPVKKQYIFHARTPGRTDLIMLYLRPWVGGEIVEKKIYPVYIV